MDIKAKKSTPISEEVKTNIATVFKSFDKDNSNSIDMKEIKLVAKELGQDISDSELKQIFGDIDTNKDNKISFTEFYNWWCYGKINKMERLVYYKLKALNLLEKSKGLQTRMGKVLGDKYESEVDTFHVAVKFGQFEPKTKIGVRFSVGKASEAAFEKLISGLDVNPKFTVVVKAKALQNAKAAEESLNNLIEGLKKSLEEATEGVLSELGVLFDLIDLKVKSDEQHVYLAITSEHEFIMEMVNNLLEVSIKDLSADFDSNINFSLNLKNDFTTLLNELSNDKLVLSLLEGFSLSVDGTVNADFAKNARKELMSQLEFAGALIPKEIRNLLILSLLKGAKVDVQLSELQKNKLEHFFKAIGSLQALQGTPSFIQLLDLFKKAGVAETLQKNPILNDIVVFIRTHLKADVEVHIKAWKLLCTLNLKTSGLKECYDYVIDRNE